MINVKEDEVLNVLNHSAAHLLAQALSNLYDGALFWVGPVINEGFYYDVDLGDEVLTFADLPKIEAEMKRLVAAALPITRRDISHEEAVKLFAHNPYKLKLLAKMETPVVTVYEQGGFVDLCRGPHVENTQVIKHFKLLKVAGAYFEGDAKQPMLQRVYGIAFNQKEDLDTYLEWLEQAKERDHKKIGPELGLFMFSEAGPGFPFWLPKGMILKRELEQFWYEEHEREGYVFIQTPILLNQALWEQSGHWDHYQEHMYLAKVETTEYALKPMNCPGCLLVYKSKLYSYRDLPLRIAELGVVHRHESSGSLNGLLRVRSFTQDDAHLFMREDQVESEILRLINFIDRLYKTFNLKYTIELSTRPLTKYIGTVEKWEELETVLKNACVQAGKECKINPGDGAFYGPKLDFHIQDSLGRVWQCATIQLDANLPARFNLTYVAEDGSKQQPIMLHRVIYGALERFIGILIEHYGGAFPLWLAPVQVNLIPVNNKYHLEYTKTLAAMLSDNQIRVQIASEDEKLSYKMRMSQINKIPYTVIIGDREQTNDTVSYRRYGEKATINIERHKFIHLLKVAIKNKD